MKAKITQIILLSLAIISCENDSEEVLPNDQNSSSELIIPESENVKSFTTAEGNEIFYEENNGDKIYQGDILLSDEMINYLKEEKVFEDNNDSEKSGKSLSAPSVLARRWTNSTVNFKISYSSRRSNFLSAINDIESNTNINFVERSSGNYIDFVQSTVCNSYIGMQGGRQVINIAPGCGTGSIIHEILHALGVFHEQSRPDRDNHIIINWSNIESGKSHNFDKELGYNYGTFDFGSIMMYSPTAFGNGRTTITRRNGLPYTSQRTALSTNDINALNDLYIGPNKIDDYSGVLDVGSNFRGDIVYARRNRSNIDIYKNGSVVQRERALGDISIDITSSGEILTSYDPNISFGFGRTARHTVLDISEGGGSVYCIGDNTRNVRLFKRNGSRWDMITEVDNSVSRLTVDSLGNPWMISQNKLFSFINNRLTSYNEPDDLPTFTDLEDVGSAGRNIFVTAKSQRNSSTILYKFSLIARDFFRIEGGATRIDGDGGGNLITD